MKKTTHIPLQACILGVLGALALSVYTRRLTLEELLARPVQRNSRSRDFIVIRHVVCLMAVLL